RMNAAEAAPERATDARVMHGGALAEERRPQIALDWHLVERRPRKSIRPLHGPLGVVPVKPEDILVGQPLNRFEFAIAAQRFQQLEKRVFALTTHHVVNVASVERGIGVDRWKITAPDNGHLGM